MPAFPILPNEKDRHDALLSYKILDTFSEQEYDELTALATIICNTPIALISLVDAERQWFKSKKGITALETDRAYSFCAHAIVNPGELFEVEDATKDMRFRDNPLVTGHPDIAFYAGVPLVNEDGYALGSLCVIDSVTRTLTSQQKSALTTIAKQVMDKMELRRKVNLLESANEEIRTSNEQLLISQELLTQNEEKFRLMADNISQLAWMANPGGEIYWYNKRWYDYTGSSFDEMKGWGWAKVHHPDHIEGVKSKIKLHFDQGLIWEDTFPLRDKDGNFQWFLSRAVPTKDKHGAVTNWFGTNTEITEQIIAREKLEAAQKHLTTAFTKLEQTEQKQSIAISQAKLGTFSINGQTGKISSSSRSKEIFGYTGDKEMPYEAVISQVGIEFQEQVRKAVEAVFANGDDFNLEFSIVDYHTGKVRWVKVTGKLYRSELEGAGNFSGTMLDITEQKEDELRKNDFIAMVSHELKTPLTSLNGFIQVLEYKAKRATDTFSENILEKAKRQIGKMTTMINGFLNISKLESGKIHIDKQRFDMKELIKEIEEEILPVTNSHHIIFDPVLTTWVDGDRDKIGQVITNYISNALKYSAPGTKIQIACVAEENCSKVSVRDEGMGIAQKDINQLFERYYRVEGHEMRSIAGFGIGLYLCSEIIKRHNGKVWVESKPKVGSTFYFSIPVIED
ncbi:ATP-binding protein [Pedobacter sp. PWIIR3]